MGKFLKNQAFIFILLISTVLIFLGMMFLNDIVKEIRLLELKAFLKEMNREDSNVDHLGMVSKYKLCKDLYENRINEKNLDSEELKTSYLIASFENQNKLQLDKYKDVAGPVIFILNLVRQILNKAPIETIIEGQTNNSIAIAYYYERNKDYEKALDVYGKILANTGLEKAKEPIIILHQGFCNAVIGNYETAKEKYLSIINNYNNENAAITAAILLKYLEEFQNEIEKVKNSKASGVEKSEQLFKLIAYKDALQVLDNVSVSDPKQKEKINYYKARCLEETGEKEESVKVYQELIQDNHESDYAKIANERILVISTMDVEGEKYKELAEKNNTLIQDESFNDLLEKSQKIEDLYKQEDNVINKSKEIFEAENVTEPKSGNEVAAENTQTDAEIAMTNGEVENTSGNTEETAEVKTTRETDIDRFISKAMKTIDKTIVEEEKKDAVEKARLEEEKRKEQTRINASKQKPYQKKYRDAQGNIFKVEQYSGTGKLEKYYVYEYDEEGNPVKILSYDSNGKLITN
ncbi:MAG: tetratricopeptide repeat protein [Spirochaetales bacterium]|nr:tetratricopeptide repeat protein [Spirochaetales bacterium]